MTTDERIKIVREAVERIETASNSDVFDVEIENLGLEWPSIKLILAEREAEREVVEAAEDMLDNHIPSERLYIAVRRLLEVRKEQEKEQ